jgi:hypothetical protein
MTDCQFLELAISIVRGITVLFDMSGKALVPQITSSFPQKRVLTYFETNLPIFTHVRSDFFPDLTPRQK